MGNNNIVRKKATNNRGGTLWLGTSGIALPGNKQSFPPAFHDKSRLHYYSSIFDSIEINSSFYKIPQPKTLLRWMDEVPAGFRFTIKLWKEITHVKDLKFKIKDIEFFMQTIVLTAAYKGCLLIQLPGKITFNYLKQVTRLLKEIVKRNHVPRWRLCIEFRHASWYTSGTYAMLTKMEAAIVLHDKTVTHNITGLPAASFVYMRFHGPAGDYKGSYPEHYLQSIAKKTNEWLSTGKDVYMYFNNTMGSAFQNAKFIQTAIQHP